ncbi:MAG TPA: hypothetical protein VFO62_12110, partial [Candidatus Binatia bacterium]|nr:hypothetical protein [Candidatus Binatia bacterium]
MGDRRQPATAGGWTVSLTALLACGARLELYTATCRLGYLEAAECCAESLLDRYQDKHNGLFFFTSADGAAVLQREKWLLDGAVPVGKFARGGSVLLAAALRRTVGYTTGVVLSPSGRSTLLEAAVEVYLPGLTVLIPADPIRAGQAALLRSQIALPAVAKKPRMDVAAA